MEEVAFEEMEFGMEQEDDGTEVEVDEEELGPGVKRITSEDACVHLTRSTNCFANTDQIKALANTSIGKCNQMNCQHANEITIKDEFIGSALYLKWVSS